MQSIQDYHLNSIQIYNPDIFPFLHRSYGNYYPSIPHNFHHPLICNQFCKSYNLNLFHLYKELDYSQGNFLLMKRIPMQILFVFLPMHNPKIQISHFLLCIICTLVYQFLFYQGNIHLCIHCIL